jgi:hypothetical protein
MQPQNRQRRPLDVLELAVAAKNQSDAAQRYLRALSVYLAGLVDHLGEGGPSS